MKDSADLILCELRESFAVVTINRVARSNIIDLAAVRKLAVVLSELRSADDVRAVVITGAGSESFAFGPDVDELSALSSEQAAEFSVAGNSLLDLMENLGKPVIAAINGTATGSGCEIAASCTWRIAVAGATFAYPEVSMGLLPGFGIASRLATLIGKSRTLELFLSAEPIGAEEALRIGLINRIAGDHQELIFMCEDLAGRIAKNAPLAIRYALDAVNHGSGHSFDSGMRLESALFGLCFATDDFREGIRAFLEKRRPVFRGR
jgi:enoyl-CoA hydratase